MIEFEGLRGHGPIIWEHFCVIWADRAVRRTATWPATSLIEDDHFYTAPSVMRNRGRGHRARDASADDRDSLHSRHGISTHHAKVQTKLMHDMEDSRKIHRVA
jgi:hypothetical protein